MPDGSLKFAPEILRRLGEELNPSMERGILELVKNAYDADARKCTVTLENTRVPGGSIQISDNGDGMSVPAIKSGWLVLGKSGKAATGRTRLGRRPAGSKGLGRLAALRLGETATLTTRPRGGKMEHAIRIDWADFDDVDTVDDVTLQIDSRKRPAKKKHGTDILIEGVRGHATNETVKRLARALVLLNNPFAERRSSFRAELAAVQYGRAANLVTNSYFDQADYHLQVRLRSGRASASVTDWRGRILWEASHEVIASERKGQRYRCPRATFDFWTFILNKPSFATRDVTIGEVRKWLKLFGGVHLFEDGLRVSPYGDPGNDWLDLNLRRAQSPEERPSTNNSIGRVSVHNRAGLLVQKTDRGGFIETATFRELRELAADGLEWMAHRRLEVAEKRRARRKKAQAQKTAKAQQSLEDAIDASPPQSQGVLRAALAEFEKSHQSEVETIRDELQLYRTLATAGIGAAVFAHESTGSQLKTMQGSIRTVKRRATEALGASEYDKKLADAVKRIMNATKALSVLGGATLELLEHEKRRVGRVEVHQAIQSVFRIYSEFLKGRGVTVTTLFASGTPYLRASEAALESVFANFLTNSIAAFDRAPGTARNISVATSIDDDAVTITYEDTGPGIEGLSLREIWLPGTTTRESGTGLGLTIVKDTVEQLGGDVAAEKQGDLGGARFTLILPLLGM